MIHLCVLIYEKYSGFFFLPDNEVKITFVILSCKLVEYIGKSNQISCLETVVKSES